MSGYNENRATATVTMSKTNKSSFKKKKDSRSEQHNKPRGIQNLATHRVQHIFSPLYYVVHYLRLIVEKQVISNIFIKNYKQL